MDFWILKNEQVYLFHFFGSLENSTKYNLGGNTVHTKHWKFWNPNLVSSLVSLHVV